MRSESLTGQPIRTLLTGALFRELIPLTFTGKNLYALLVDEKYEPSTKKGKFSKSISNFNKKIGVQELNIQLGQIKINEVKLTEFILAMISVGPEERKENWTVIKKRT